MTEQASEAPPTVESEVSDYVADIGFDDLGLVAEVRRAIDDRGYKAPTPVQARTIPVALTGRDVIVRSKTGTGKTAAFGIPLAQRIAPEHVTKAIVLCPTRELAIQVAEELQALSRHRGLRVAAIYGGAPMQPQIDALTDGAEIVVGTPGRVYDHIRRKTLDLSKAQAAVLDEADEMLNQGFYEEVTRILERVPEGRQTMLFSASMPPDIERLIKRFTNNPETIHVSGDDFTVEGIDNVIYYTVDAYPKPRNLIYLLDLEEPEAAIIFCNTRDDTTLVNAVLNRNGFDSEVLNGDLLQKERERVMNKIKRGELEYLVATDIAARGIDISDLTHIINYSLPEDPAVYLHRAGRTGRIGKKGVATSLISGRELVTMSALERRYGIKFEERKLPTPEEARARWTERHVDEMRDAAKGAVWEAMVPLAQDLKARDDGDQLVAFLLRYFFTHHRMERAVERQSEPAEPKPREGPAPRERDRGSRGERGARFERREERPEKRRERTEGGGEKSVEAGPGGTRLWCNLGTADGVTEAGLADAVATLTGVERSAIRSVEARSTHAYLFAEPAVVDKLVAATGNDLAGKKLRIEVARPRR